MKNRTISLILVCALLMGSLSFSAFAEGSHTHEDCCSVDAASVHAVSPTAMQTESCPECGEYAATYVCNQDYETYDTDTHQYLSDTYVRLTCTIKYYTSQTYLKCNQCDYNKPVEWHPFCDEEHFYCDIGLVPCCTIDYY